MEASPTLEAAIQQVCAGDVAGLLVDLSHVSFLDATGIRVLLAGQKLAEQRGVAFQAINPRGLVRRSLDTTGVLTLLTGCREPGSARDGAGGTDGSSSQPRAS
jgi:anti-anti-sigma factor